MNLYECVLDSLADDGESIIQIEGYFKHTTHKINRIEIKMIIIELLNEELIYIAYPPNKTKENFIKSNKKTIKDFWFELSPKGKERWSKIEY